MTTSATFKYADAVLNGQLTAHLERQRRLGNGYETIAKGLWAEWQIDVSGATVRRWCISLQLDEEQAS